MEHEFKELQTVEVYRSMGQDILRVLNEADSHSDAIQRVLGIVKKVIGVDAVGIRLQDADDFPYYYQEGFSQDFLLKENSLLARTKDGGICRDACGNICLECTCGLVITGRTDPSSHFFTPGGSCWTSDSLEAADIPAAEDPRVNPRNECLHQGYASIALIPIRAKGQNVGLLQLNDRRTGRFTLGTIEVLEDIAKNIGEAMLRKQAEEKLILSERFLRSVTDQLPGMVGYWDRDLRCRFANKGYIEWFGRTPEEMIGLSIQELMGEELFRMNEPHMRRALQGERQHFERTLVKPDGKTGFTWAHYIPDVTGNEVRGFFVLVSDVTELKQAEDEKAGLERQLHQAQKMESIGRLAGGVAHDFNNMLSVILGHAEIALMRMDAEHPVYASIKEISRAAERSADLTRQLLAFARKQTVSPRLIDLNETVASMLNMMQRLIGENIRLVWQPSAVLWPVMVDKSQIDQVMANLCVNARDAIDDQGTITIATENCGIGDNYSAVHPDAQPGNYVKLTISDSGSGMNREVLSHIFEPFFTTKGVGEGTGLGLATVYGIVRQNNGFINVYSEPGIGTTFSIYLPRHAGGDEFASPETMGETLCSGNEMILLVEDEPAILEVAKMLLTELGYRLLTAATPAEAFRLAQGHAGEIHLLITDVIMPEMNGRELAGKLLALYPQIKCLFMSGYTADIIAHHGVLDEGVSFIQKPFQITTLSAKLREVLDR